MVKVSVTRKHIKRGTCGSTARCAVALAVADATGEDDICAVESYIYVGRTTRYNTPQVVCEFMSKFDKRVECEPFEFEMELATC
jgi:hypothetical protein